jgi:hypothetical protein
LEAGVFFEVGRARACDGGDREAGDAFETLFAGAA